VSGAVNGSAGHGAIVVGGGHNGLVVAYYLAKAGMRPLVLERRDIVGGACVTEEFAPGFVAREVLSPLDFERRFNMTGGHPLHGEMGFDQLFNLRPTRGYADYRTPVENLYLCGAGTHPGGGVTGANGRNAA
jgi:phytoene dehydrogenase-like protein